MSLTIRILTVRQPWATALLTGGKDVENRSWPTRYRGWILIHSGQTIDRDVPERYASMLGDQQPESLPRGYVLGGIYLTDVVQTSQSPWARPLEWHWCHDTTRACVLEVPVPWRGALGLQFAPPELLRLLPRHFRDHISA